MDSLAKSAHACSIMLPAIEFLPRKGRGRGRGRGNSMRLLLPGLNGGEGKRWLFSHSLAREGLQWISSVFPFRRAYHMPKGPSCLYLRIQFAKFFVQRKVSIHAFSPSNSFPSAFLKTSRRKCLLFTHVQT